MKQIVMLGLMGLLAGCASLETAVDSTARQATKGVVTEALATRFPAVPKQLIEPFTGCIIDNAKSGEVRDLAKDAVKGVDDGTVLTIRNILARPETVSCIKTQTLNNLTG